MPAFEAYDFVRTLKGGEGSGNFGHAGRPGQVGGSGPGKGAKKPSYHEWLAGFLVDDGGIKDGVRDAEAAGFKVYRDYADLPPVKEGYTRLYHGTMSRNLASIHEIGLFNQADLVRRGIVNLPLESATPWVLFTTGAQGTEEEGRWHGNVIVVADVPKASVVGTHERGSVVGLKSVAPERLVGIYVPKPSLPASGISPSKFGLGDNWSNFGGWLDERKAEYERLYGTTSKGGRGSGNFGHAGRPGQVGGSRADSSRAPGLDPQALAEANQILSKRNDPHTREQGARWARFMGLVEEIAEKSSIRENELLNEGLPSRDDMIATWDVDRDFPMYRRRWSAASEETRSQIKDEICQKVAKSAGVEYETVDQILESWASTANDASMRALSLQQAAVEEFGGRLSEWQQQSYDARREYLRTHKEELRNQYQANLKANIDMRESARKMLRDYQEYYPQYPPLKELIQEANLTDRNMKAAAKRMLRMQLGDHLPVTDRSSERKVLRAMYQETQAQLKKAGLEYVTVYRGVGMDTQGLKSGDSVRWQGNMVESWTASVRKAMDFAVGKHALVVAIRVPASQVLSTCRTGFGCLVEGEFTLLGNTDTRVRIVAADPWPAQHTKGGVGSGNWGHAGRPGHVGGSQPGKGGGASPAGEMRFGPPVKLRGSVKWGIDEEAEAKRYGIPVEKIHAIGLEFDARKALDDVVRAKGFIAKGNHHWVSLSDDPDARIVAEVISNLPDPKKHGAISLTVEIRDKDLQEGATPFGSSGLYEPPILNPDQGLRVPGKLELSIQSDNSDARKAWTVAHEFGHIYNLPVSGDLSMAARDPELLGLLGYSTQPVGQKVINGLNRYYGYKGPEFYYINPKNKPLTDYGHAHPDESFAESFAAYMVTPKVLKGLRPKLYNWLRDRIFDGIEYEGYADEIPLTVV